MQKEHLYDALIKELSGMGNLLISYSGGIDSTLLAVLAGRASPERVKCVLLDASIIPRRAVGEAVENSWKFRLSCEIMSFPVLENEEFRNNSPDRCYICKKIYVRLLRKRAEKLGISEIADGINVSDLREYRPGLKASGEEGINYPFPKAGIRKSEIRELARDCGLGIWDKPSSSCLAPGIPYGEEITAEKLRMIEKAENFMQDQGFSRLGVRMHGRTARRELIPEEFERAMNIRNRIVEAIGGCVFSYITLNLKGYRSGSMDEVL